MAMSSLPMGRDWETADLLGTIGILMLLMAAVLAQSGKRQWAADRPLSLLLNLVGSLLTTIASLLALFWPFVLINSIWAICSGYHFARVIMDRRDIRIAAQANA